MKNRQQRRHPTFPGFPLLRPYREKVPIQKNDVKINSKGYKSKKVKTKNRTG